MKKNSVIPNHNYWSSLRGSENYSSPFFNPVFQPKLIINQPNDVYEQEADAMADKVMRMEQPLIQAKPLPVTSLQRKCAACEEEEKAHRKEMNNGETSADSSLESYVGSLNNGGHSLSNEVRSFYEPRFGYDFSNVKIHTDTNASKSAQSINALAYTSGSNIVFNDGQFSPDTDSGKRLLGHELTHVVQQNQTNELSGVQTNMADEHNLQSDNFSGDGELEACYDGNAPYYQRTGKRGVAVSKIQDALLQLGYELPVYGVDGIFMQETMTAVKTFQSDYQLATDGIVGPFTIGKMDELLSNAAPEPPKPLPPIIPPEPQPAEQCTPDQNLPVQAKKIPGKKIQKATAKGPVVQCKHITMRESMDEFSKKVNSSAAVDPLVTANGQFYWSLLSKQLIGAEITKNYTFLDPISGKVSELIFAINNNDTKTINTLMKEIPQDIEKSGISNAPDLVKIFLPAINVESPMALWAKFNKEGKVPADFAKKYTNFNAYIQLRNAEKTLCWSMAEFIMKRFEEKGGYTDIDSSKKGKTKPSFTSTLITSATRNFEWTGDKTKGDVVNYSASTLASDIAKIKKAIDDGFTLHARVVSGVNFGTGLSPAIKASKLKNPPPEPVQVNGSAEHSLVIIGYEDTSDEFIFWDPDSSVSSYQGRRGFGILHLLSNRFTTASTEADLLVNEDGLHSGGSANKRYQVLTVTI